MFPLVKKKNQKYKSKSWVISDGTQSEASAGSEINWKRRIFKDWIEIDEGHLSCAWRRPLTEAEKTAAKTHADDF